MEKLSSSPNEWKLDSHILPQEREWREKECEHNHSITTKVEKASPIAASMSDYLRFADSEVRPTASRSFWAVQHALKAQASA